MQTEQLIHYLHVFLRLGQGLTDLKICFPALEYVCYRHLTFFVINYVQPGMPSNHLKVAQLLRSTEHKFCVSILARQTNSFFSTLAVFVASRWAEQSWLAGNDLINWVQCFMTYIMAKVCVSCRKRLMGRAVAVSAELGRAVFRAQA